MTYGKTYEFMRVGKNDFPFKASVRWKKTEPTNLSTNGCPVFRAQASNISICYDRSLMNALERAPLLPPLHQQKIMYKSSTCIYIHTHR